MIAGRWLRGNSLSAGHLCTELLPMAASNLSPRSEMVFRRHVPPAQVPLLKTSTFDLMTRSALIAQAPAQPEQSTFHRDARKVGETVEPVRSAVTENDDCTGFRGREAR